MSKQITSLQHSSIKHIVKLRQNHDYRDEHQSVVISGKKEVEEIGRQVHVKLLLVYDDTWIPKGIDADEVLVVNEEIMRKASGLQNPEGIIAEVSLPKLSKLDGLKSIVVLDGVSDPGNLGTILRTALALNWDGAFILEESCDPFNDKALRAARGAAFRLPIARGSWKDLLEIINKNQLRPLVGDLRGTALSEIKLNSGVALVLSNEARGVSEDAANYCERVTIPISHSMESLNVAIAGGILMYTLRR